MKKPSRRGMLFGGAALMTLLLAGWIGFYSYRSHHGSYHEVIQDGGIAYAVWFPSDFEPRRVAPPRPPGETRRGRYAPETILPEGYPFDWPLQAIDRRFFHRSVQTISGQGDMARLYGLSPDGKSLTSTSHRN